MSTSRRIAGAVLVSVLATWATTLAGCGGAACLRDSDCGSELECREGACVAAAGKSSAAAGTAGSSAGHAGTGGAAAGMGGVAGRAMGGMSGSSSEIAGMGGSP